jgi:hypothetical protein
LKALLKRAGFAVIQEEYSNRISTAHIMIATNLGSPFYARILHQLSFPFQRRDSRTRRL